MNHLDILSNKKLLIFIAALSIGASIFTLWNSDEVTAALVTKQELIRVSRLAASQYEIFVDQTRQILTILSKIPQIGEDGGDACNKILASLIADEKRFINFGVLDKNGVARCSALPFEKPMYGGDREYFKRVINTGEFSVGDYQIGRLTGKASVNFGYPLIDADGAISGVVFAALDLAWFNNFADHARLPDGSQFVITDSKGLVLASYPERQSGTLAREISVPIEDFDYIEKDIGILKTRDDKGKKFFLVASPLKLEDQEGFFHMIISVPQSSIRY